LPELNEEEILELKNMIEIPENEEKENENDFKVEITSENEIENQIQSDSDSDSDSDSEGEPDTDSSDNEGVSEQESAVMLEEDGESNNEEWNEEQQEQQPQQEAQQSENVVHLPAMGGAPILLDTASRAGALSRLHNLLHSTDDPAAGATEPTPSTTQPSQGCAVAPDIYAKFSPAPKPLEGKESMWRHMFPPCCNFCQTKYFAETPFDENNLPRQNPGSGFKDPRATVYGSEVAGRRYSESAVDRMANVGAAPPASPSAPSAPSPSAPAPTHATTTPQFMEVRVDPPAASPPTTAAASEHPAAAAAGTESVPGIATAADGSGNVVIPDADDARANARPSFRWRSPALAPGPCCHHCDRRNLEERVIQMYGRAEAPAWGQWP